jgi:membrane-bound lytic murein transglycosylase A
MVGCGRATRLLVLALLQVSCDGAVAGQSEPAVLSIPNSQLEPLTWSEVPGWMDDDQALAFDAFLASCTAIATRKAPRRDARPIDAALAAVCRDALALGPASTIEARAFFQTRFRPVHITAVGNPDGFLTGYYEPIVQGSRQPTRDFTVPVYRRPDDLVSAVKSAAGVFPSRGGAYRLADNNQLLPYYERGEIEDGALQGKGLEICWLKDPVDAFFIQIQGSARVRLEDGAMLRLNYDGYNGYPYTAIGRVLVERGEVAKDEMSMDRIRVWMRDHPDEAKEVRRQNRSFVFFRVTDLTNAQEAIGGQGIPLTAGRSIAVDSKLHAYGTPFWIDATLPISGATSNDAFRRLMIAQDTGSAIVGPARADIYFGGGDEAGKIAGRVRQPGRFVMLVPESMQLGATPGAAAPPYPPARPPR